MTSSTTSVSSFQMSRSCMFGFSERNSTSTICPLICLTRPVFVFIVYFRVLHFFLATHRWFCCATIDVMHEHLFLFLQQQVAFVAAKKRRTLHHGILFFLLSFLP